MHISLIRLPAAMQEMDYRRLLLTTFFGGAMISELASHALLAVADTWLPVK